MNRECYYSATRIRINLPPRQFYVPCECSWGALKNIFFEHLRHTVLMLLSLARCTPLTSFRIYSTLDSAPHSSELVLSLHVALQENQTTEENPNICMSKGTRREQGTALIIGTLTLSSLANPHAIQTAKIMIPQWLAMWLAPSSAPSLLELTDFVAIQVD